MSEIDWKVEAERLKVLYDSNLAYACHLVSTLRTERHYHAERISELLNEVSHYDLRASALQWREMTDAVWIDGRDVVLLAHDMEVTARYCPGGPVQCGLEGVEYDGAVWSCFDDEFQFEIEEISNDPKLWHHGPVTHWREPTPRDSNSDRSP